MVAAKVETLETLKLTVHILQQGGWGSEACLWSHLAGRVILGTKGL